MERSGMRVKPIGALSVAAIVSPDFAALHPGYKPAGLHCAAWCSLSRELPERNGTCRTLVGRDGQPQRRRRASTLHQPTLFFAGVHLRWSARPRHAPAPRSARPGTIVMARSIVLATVAYPGAPWVQGPP